MPTQRIAVYGPTGYTGRQVVGELRRRGIVPILAGRDAGRLRAVRGNAAGEIRPASLDAPAALRAAFEGADAVINCAGPFETSAGPVVAAALAVGAHYLDFTAEQAAVLLLSERWDAVARDAHASVLPGLGFFGGLGDLLASVAAAGVTRPRTVTVAYAVDGWLLTEASRATAVAMAGRRWVRHGGRLELVTGERRYGSFRYPEPRGTQPVMEDYPLPEALSIPRHIDVPDIRIVMTASTLREIFGTGTPAPGEVTDAQRASSRFTVVAAVSDGRSQQQAVATGGDIYGLTAPMIVAAAVQLIAAQPTGVLAPSQAVDPASFLAELKARGVAVERAPARTN
jgi:short subunit dehydrogenase-like uncharacterized protein